MCVYAGRVREGVEREKSEGLEWAYSVLVD
jgi:hypothetical protein